MLKSSLCLKYRGMFLTLLKHKYKKKKRRHLAQFYDKSPTCHRKNKKATEQHKNIDYTTVADELRTIFWR